MALNIWNFWAKNYDKLWVQKYSLKPTREMILKLIEENNKEDSVAKVLDLGCGPGEIISLLEDKYKNFNITGIDFSEEMLKVSRARNFKARHIHLDVKDLGNLKEKFNIIICTHSFPYYKDMNAVILDLNRLLEDDGKLYIAFASGNNFYDKFALSFVKLTTGFANYPSDDGFRKIVSGSFNVESINIIKEKTYMPRIAVYKLRKSKI